jgi:hypothetical protein
MCIVNLQMLFVVVVVFPVQCFFLGFFLLLLLFNHLPPDITSEQGLKGFFSVQYD